MNRRGFLAALGITAAASAAGLALPELWTPKRTFFLPPRTGWAPRPETITITAAGGEPPSWQHAPEYQYQWTWLRGGGALTIDDPTSSATTFTPRRRDWSSLAVAASGVAICTITDSRGRQYTTRAVNVEFAVVDDRALMI